MFGINSGEFIVLLVLVLVVVGPERLPHYAQQLATFVRGAAGYAKSARQQLRDEMGPEFDDIDWQKLDPRQYDPRRIVREALTDVWDDDTARPTGSTAISRPAAVAAGSAAGATAAGAAAGSGAAPARPGPPRVERTTGPVPFDAEAT